MVTLNILDISGKKVFNETSELSSLKKISPNLPSGVYFLKLEFNDKVETFKLFKSK